MGFNEDRKDFKDDVRSERPSTSCDDTIIERVWV